MLGERRHRPTGQRKGISVSRGMGQIERRSVHILD